MRLQDHQNDVLRQKCLNRNHLNADVIQKSGRRERRERVVMKAAVLEVLERPCLEILKIPGKRIPGEIMEFQYFRQMRQIVLVHPSVEIIFQVVEGRRRPPLVERAFLVWQHQNDDAIVLQNSQPFAES